MRSAAQIKDTRFLTVVGQIYNVCFQFFFTDRRKESLQYLLSSVCSIRMSFVDTQYRIICSAIDFIIEWSGDTIWSKITCIWRLLMNQISSSIWLIQKCSRPWRAWGREYVQKWKKKSPRWVMLLSSPFRMLLFCYRPPLFRGWCFRFRGYTLAKIRDHLCSQI